MSEIWMMSSENPEALSALERKQKSDNTNKITQCILE